MKERHWDTLISFLGGVVIGLAITQAGCAATQKVVDTANAAIDTAKSGVYLAHVAEPFLVAAYEAAQEKCIPEPDPSGVNVITADMLECLKKVRSDWEPVRAAFVELRQNFCKLDKLIDGKSCPEESAKQ